MHSPGFMAEASLYRSSAHYSANLKVVGSNPTPAIGGTIHF